jgi:hypothetical protein
MKRPLACIVPYEKLVDLDPLNPMDSEAINAGFKQKQEVCYFNGVVMDQITMLRGESFVDISLVYNPETKTIISYPSELVKIDQKEVERSVKKDWE